MYKFLKSNLTLFNKVWELGTEVSDQEAKRIGLDVWYKETNGETWKGKFVHYVNSGRPRKDDESRKNSENIVPSKKTRTVQEVLEEKGMSLDQVKHMEWKPLVKIFGPKLAKEVRDYDKSNSNTQ